MIKRLGLSATLLALLMGGFLITRGATDSPADASTTTTAAKPITDTVTRRSLEQAEEFTGSLGYGDEFALPGNAIGTVSWVPEEGRLLQPGDVLYRVDEKPTMWARGDIPMYRELSSGSKGTDVEQLQRYLQQGEYLAEDFEVDGKFGNATRSAVKKWQKDNGLEETGRVDFSQLMFLPYKAIRVAAVPRVGDAAIGGVLRVTEPDLHVTVDVGARKKHAFEGAPVIEVETADGTRFAATVDSITALQSQDAFGGQNYRVLLDLGTAADHEPGQVSVDVVEVLASDVLTVPARALVALVEGGYAVETLSADGATTYVAVTLGEFADGWVEVDGELDEGDAVVVPE